MKAAALRSLIHLFTFLTGHCRYFHPPRISPDNATIVHNYEMWYNSKKIARYVIFLSRREQCRAVMKGVNQPVSANIAGANLCIVSSHLGRKRHFTFLSKCSALRTTSNNVSLQ